MQDTKFIHKLIILLIGSFLTTGIVGAQVNNAGNSQQLIIHRIDSILQSQVNDSKIPGAVIEIKRGDAVIYKQAYGFAQKFNYRHELLAEPEKMTTEHMFDIASLTKVVGTTTSIMLLVDKGLIKVDDPVGKYIKAFTTPDKASITIRHLLTHTAGLYEWYPLYYRAGNKQETFKLIGELPLAFPVGAQRKYSDLGFTVLGEIVEVVSGQSLDQFEEQNIFKPLGMTHTMYNPLQKSRDFKIASTSFGNPYEHRMVYDPELGYQFKEIKHDQWNGWRHYILKGEVNDGNAWYAEKGVAGAAGIFSTVDDIQKLVDMLMNKGKVGNVQFISENTINAFLTKDKFNNGLGWMMDPENSFMKNGPEGTFGHTGFTGTSICVVPSKDVSIILLINRQQMGLIDNKEYYNVNAIRALVFKAVMAYCKAN
ncbi:serine hydrolase domain-containing protein [Mucilaginibacter gotjawali]|uniref:CubicO group peptidase (Beta-lactamase class C family) n=1 Tax=Mucilaginibacter gotjawali TaxID=1550579 RepID=A0A839SJR9_9SPHI|nr:serine hydrolase [Mucilaginibacter gotjawali]MBB3056789.1 CubicO group peptidase (beta-lactamase class C family) [Mucilaginibacter gotjawali]